MDTVKKTIKLSQALFSDIDRTAKRANLTFSDALRMRLETDHQSAQTEHRLAQILAEQGSLLDKLTAQNLLLMELIGATLGHAAFARKVMEHSIQAGSRAEKEAQNAATEAAHAVRNMRERVQLSVFDEDENG